MYTDTSLKLVLQETEFSVPTMKQEQGTMLLSLPVWCCKMELNLRAKLQQDKVGGFLDHLNFCLCFLM